ncbi:MAG: ORF6N domain-containing protein [Moraxella osloensis]|nr:ORF6N domain-containing protein [Moraxella osloensis]
MLETLDENAIKSKIYTLRNVQVMLDRDLAELYQVKAIRLREQVKRNPSRFPDDFMFQLTPEEVESMVSQNAIPSKKHLGA